MVGSSGCPAERLASRLYLGKRDAALSAAALSSLIVALPVLTYHTVLLPPWKGMPNISSSFKLQIKKSVVLELSNCYSSGYVHYCQVYRYHGKCSTGRELSGRCDGELKSMVECWQLSPF